MATLTVGTGQQYSTIKAAVAASKDGDVVQVQAGTYTNEFIEVNTKITLQGVGGMVKLEGTEWTTNDKGLLVTNTDVTVDHFEFTGATGSGNNAAGIRYQGGNLVVTNSYFHDNQNGILANSDPSGTITITNSEFSHNGYGDGYTHNIYVNDVAKLTIADSYFHDAVYGHEIKSRATATEIVNNRIFDNGGDASYSIDLPNGGQAVISGNIIQQGANSANPNIVAYGAEGNLHSSSSLAMTGNVIINDMPGRGAVLMNASGSPTTFDGNSVYGVNQLISGTGVSESNTTYLSSAPGLDQSSPIDGVSSGGGSAPVAGPVQHDGTAGNDVLAADANVANRLRGFEGDDQITGNANAFSDINGNQGQDTITGHSSVGDWLLGGQGDDLISAVQSSGNNIINGNIGVDNITGGTGADILRGGQGDDQIRGSGGDDWISGDMGNNTVTGGAGADTFHATTNGGVSTVTDFNGAAGDRVHLDADVQYHLSQQGADLHVVLDSGQGGELVLQNTNTADGWILQG
ncbi:right-handed parallel beta-helix repeat-containing protein [Phenylobacterium sp. LjRoot219]|uniref:right-handed parallel beta-helix repeat-containing protein n=1 Tax=Phenylobacterium sp. LjRoot219 TaxID=3342283 RepID=UPI003ECD69EA